MVTGGSGYLGSVLCEHLLAGGHEVVVVDNFLFGQTSLFHLCANPGLEIVKGDARDMSLIGRQLKGVDAIIPLAALVGAPMCDREPRTALSVNFEAIRDLNRLRGSGQLMVFPATNSGYGTRTGDTFCTEETPLEPISLYGTTKADAEKEVLARENAISLRLTTVFGCSPRMRTDLLVNHFTWSAVNDGYIVIFEKGFKRNFIHIRDVADCFVFCLAKSQSMVGRPYNVGLDSTNLSKEGLVLKVREHVPNFYVHYSEVGTDPDRRNYTVSTERLRLAGFEPKRDLDQGIRELLKAYRTMRKNNFGNC